MHKLTPKYILYGRVKSSSYDAHAHVSSKIVLCADRPFAFFFFLITVRASICITRVYLDEREFSMLC